MPRDGGASAADSTSRGGPLPLLHAIAGPEETTREGFLALAGRLFEACGADLALHLRLPGEPGGRLWELAAALARTAAGPGGWCVVNGRPDVALAAGAQAVQVGRRALPLAEVVRLVDGRLQVGASVHEPAEAVEAARDGANFLLLGTIYDTPSHPGRPGAGPGLVSEARRALTAAGAADVPVVAIGGIEASGARAVRRAGAHGAAARRAVWSTEDPAESAARLVAALCSA